MPPRRENRDAPDAHNVSSLEAPVADALRRVSPGGLLPVSSALYAFGEEFARGGLGRIFVARDLRTGRVVAIKQIRGPDPDLRARFAREALVTANLQHPSIIPVYEVGRLDADEPFIAMKLVKGHSLDDLVAEAPGTAERLALLPHVTAVADAIAYAHGEGIIHRDLKPANVLVGPYGETVVIDWGLARSVSSAPEESPASIADAPARDAVNGETIAGAVLGTPAYMPPEQARGEVVDARADVYAIGAILYHVLGGVRPYADSTGADTVMRRVMDGPPRSLIELSPGLPPELIAIVQRAMATHPAERYATAGGLADDLRKFQAGHLVGAYRYTPWQVALRWVRRNRALVGTVTAAVLALGVFGAYSLHRITVERDEAARQRAAAMAAREISELRLGDGLTDLGRQSLLAGDPGAAMAYLSGAWTRRPEGPAVLRFLAGRARTAFATVADVIPGNTSGTTFAEITPDGAMVLTDGADGTLRGWDVLRHRTTWAVAGPVYFSLSPDGRSVVGTQDDGTVTFVSTRDGNVLHREVLARGEGSVVVAWAPNSEHVAVGGNQGTVGVWMASAPWTAMIHPRAHAGEIRDARYAPDGHRFTTAGADGALLIWDEGANGPPRALGGHLGGASTVAWMGNAVLVSGGADHRVAVWDADTGAMIREMDTGEDIYRVVVNREETRIVSALVAPTAVVWDAATGTALMTLGGHDDGVNNAVFAGNELVTTDEAGTLREWDLARRALVRTTPSEGLVQTLHAGGNRLVLAGAAPRVRILRTDARGELTWLDGHSGWIRSMTFDRAGTVAYTASNDGTARAWRVATGAEVFRVGLREPVPDAPPKTPGGIHPPDPHGLRSVVLSHDGTTLVTSCEDGTVGLWNAVTGVAQGSLRGHTGRVRVPSVGADGTVLTAGADGTARLWNLAARRETQRVTAAAPLQTAAWLPSLNRLVTLEESGRVALWDGRTGERVRGRPVPQDRLPWLVSTPGGLLVTTQPDTARLIDLRDGTVAAEVRIPMIFSVDVSTDGAWLAVGNAMGNVALADARTGAVIRSWWMLPRASVTARVISPGDPADPPPDPSAHVVVACRFRPDGIVLATLGGDHIVRVWETASGRLLAMSQPFPGIATDVRWSPDGRTLGIYGVPPAAWLWDLSPDTGNASSFVSRAACASPWTLHGTTLTSAPADPVACRNGDGE